MRILAAALLLVLSANTYAIEIKPSLSGSWYNPQQSGHGFSIEVMDENTSVIYWYVYDHNGEPIFLIAVGKNNGDMIEANAYYQDGMKFGEFNREDVNQVPWGTVDIEFHSCNSATMTYESDMSHSGQVFGTGSIDLVRLASIANNKCTENRLGGNYIVTGANKYGDGLIGYVMVFENGTTMYFGGSPGSNDAAVGIGFITERSNNFVLNAQEFGVTDNYYYEYEIVGEYHSPGIFQIEGGIGALVGVEARSEFMKPVPVTTMAKNWSLRDGYGQDAGDIRLHQNGAVSGRVYGGCDVSGEWFFPNPEFNQTWMNLQLSNCDTSGESYAAAHYSHTDRDLTIIGVTLYGGYYVVGN